MVPPALGVRRVPVSRQPVSAPGKLRRDSGVTGGHRQFGPKGLARRGAQEMPVTECAWAERAWW